MSIKSSVDAIIATLGTSYDRALESQDLFFFPSTSHTLPSEQGVEFLVRHCPALLHKPTLPTPHFEGPSKPKGGDPFAPPYVPNLFVGELEENDEDETTEYIILLNKFSVVPHHFLLVTKEFQSQSTPLLPTDLLAAYKLLKAAQSAGRPMFAFYNCGDRSGASQAHKHMQFLPLEDPDGFPTEKLAKNAKMTDESKPFSITSLPYANHVIRFPTSLPTSSSTDQLSTLVQSFLALLDLSITTIRNQPSHSHTPGPNSYNVLLTLHHLHMIPRLQEKHKLRETGEEMSVNAVGFAGMLLVKSEEELEAVRKEGVANILKGIAMQAVGLNLAEPHLIDLDTVS